MRAFLPFVPVLLLPAFAAGGELIHLEFNDPTRPFGDLSPYHHVLTPEVFTEDIITGAGVTVDPASGSPAGGGAARFDGGSRLRIPASDAFYHSTSEPFTVRFWFRSPGIRRSYGTGYYTVMYPVYFGSGAENFAVDLDDPDGAAGLWTYWSGSGSHHTWSGPGTMFDYTDDTWYEYHWVWDGSTAYGYVRAEGGPWTLLETRAWTNPIGSATASNFLGSSGSSLAYIGWIDGFVMVDMAVHPDLCPGTPGMDDADADGDLIGDACDPCLGDHLTGDQDLDRVCDDRDNCDLVPNPGQEDLDADETGDRCETELYLDLVGTCPGPIDVTIGHLRPGGAVAIVRSASPGTFTVPTGACAGTVLGLAAPATLAAMLTAPPSGTIHSMPTFAPAMCGSYVQIVDMATCRTSPVTQIP